MLGPAQQDKQDLWLRHWHRVVLFFWSLLIQIKRRTSSTVVFLWRDLMSCTRDCQRDFTKFGHRSRIFTSRSSLFSCVILLAAFNVISQFSRSSANSCKPSLSPGFIIIHRATSDFLQPWVWYSDTSPKRSGMICLAFVYPFWSGECILLLLSLPSLYKTVPEVANLYWGPPHFCVMRYWPYFRAWNRENWILCAWFRELRFLRNALYGSSTCVMPWNRLEPCVHLRFRWPSSAFQKEISNIYEEKKLQRNVIHFDG